jgi:hypothetical protein
MALAVGDERPPAPVPGPPALALEEVAIPTEAGPSFRYDPDPNPDPDPVEPRTSVGGGGNIDDNILKFVVSIDVGPPGPAPPGDTAECGSKVAP